MAGEGSTRQVDQRQGRPQQEVSHASRDEFNGVSNVVARSISYGHAPNTDHHQIHQETQTTPPRNHSHTGRRQALSRVRALRPDTELGHPSEDRGSDGCLFYATVNVAESAVEAMVDPGSSATILSFGLFQDSGKTGSNSI